MMTEFEARARAFVRAAGTCECTNIGCAAPTHPIDVQPGEIRFGRCTAAVSVSGIGADVTAVLPVHAYDDQTDPDNLLVLCEPCANKAKQHAEGGQ